MKRLIVLMIAIFVALIAVVAVPIGIRQMRIAAAVNEIATTGAPTTIADLQANHVWDSCNAAWHLDAVDPDTQKLFAEIRPTFYDNESFDWRDGIPEATRGQLETAFATYPQVFAAVHSAIQCDYYSNFDKPASSITAFQQQLFDRVGIIRSVHRVLDARYRFLAATEQFDKAARVAVDALTLVRLQEQDPTIIQFMTAAGCRNSILDFLAELVASDSLSENVLGIIDAELRRHVAMDSFVHALQTERALGIELSSKTPLGLAISGQLIQPYLDYMRDQIAMGAISRFEEAAPMITAKAAEVAVVAPAMDSGRALMNRQRAKIRCLRLLIALHKQSLVNETSLSPISDAGPHEIAELIAEFEKTSEWGLSRDDVIDPFSGQPLIVQRLNGYWQVYSVGENQRDDEGDFKDDLDVGFPTLDPDNSVSVPDDP
ncbi:hypothetical protein [Rhodopirellula sp. SWK7]|uniref:hypothetical protein n=1 Tax=Rhodopirellula sp. SWK7 TaxID=595460 RepID=UPI0002C03343|nr:hypothetical protein [Rhodopirellula sp. SWK7]EMI47234.1 putative membrane or secreted protein [Rhodopirellula sp. SWK7]